ncbi:FAD-binding oxidoreductase [uncultured Chryseobacterium sp.]|uniref:FAD-binding oxidoreductase n=1 Tax=uncultured Chryseobacterium sp. TaxID=259322 RepID=UPI0025FEEB43|nr:FAD-binding oxidoreductase [uncultured Chryseobacterium sp.]
MISDKQNILSEIKKIVGEESVITDVSRMYAHSATINSDEVKYPIGIIIPKTAEEVSSIMKYCYYHDVKVSVRGGGTNVNGSAVSIGGDFILSTEKLNRILEISKIDRTATVETGVITEHINKEAAQYGLMFSQNISSSSQCFIGGNIATSAGSPYSLKYGTIKNAVINLEVVLPDGEIIWTGKNVTKNATGYNLTQLFIGSEGTLGIITKAVIKLEPVLLSSLIVVPFTHIEKLFEFADLFFESGFEALCMEFLDKKGCELVTGFLEGEGRFKPDIEGLLWIEFENHPKFDLEKFHQLISEYTPEDILYADENTGKERLWKYRKQIGEAAVSYSSFRDIDIVVPRSKSLLLYKTINSICLDFDFEFIVIGHIGDGNFHINIFNNKDKDWDQAIEGCLLQIYKAVNTYGGTISGEHGVGALNNRYLDIVMSEYQINVLKQIKNLFDPKNILNNTIIF